jgi:hypothetical protein
VRDMPEVCWVRYRKKVDDHRLDVGVEGRHVRVQVGQTEQSPVSRPSGTQNRVGSPPRLRTGRKRYACFANFLDRLPILNFGHGQIVPFHPVFHVRDSTALAGLRDDDLQTAVM